MITVHHLNNSRSQRILWLLEELELEYEIIRYERDKETLLAPDAMHRIHPLGKSPIVVDGDMTLTESGAVVEFFVEQYGVDQLAPPPGTAERQRYRQWLHYAEGSAMPPLLLKLIFDRMEKAPVPFVVRPIVRSIARNAKSSFIKRQLDQHFGYVEAELGKSEWFAGDKFTAADIQMSFPIEVATARGELSHDTPNLMSFLERIHARPAYQKALERGGDYSIVS